MQLATYNIPEELDPDNIDAGAFQWFLESNPPLIDQAQRIAALAAQEIGTEAVEGWAKAEQQVYQWLKDAFQADWPMVSEETWSELSKWLLGRVSM
ncbi:MAG: hypothetical protein LJE59_14360 [Chromatiaceae bacterium]|jgi:hypothetical protein|nr:hypothetical protein [Chromatiaceae bacterium]